ncbi:hypothetical protein, variant [Puccinia triticina 1-1 BBBD Race 1]|uniref:Uncharacterized protein n=2 Tax=Puccinia triticina TaxID=208348 RepID=A0A180H4Y9_PUCT1|nr:uncharacterized protein PtA15_2A550 [Puccinia triticina]OAV99737.1 hypothetical protein PTTG_25279 [Puccinia triticina 1-1 BBBD Race 1]OAV99738.1 hypothetical protein, variant [Puccinia triticina 1-1 BBBD Race 1]WAQ82233.1 hypothetical protein PtA15_2A550 [Puccinia triticina]WAR53086.1 hypothetical protein PtB15_2B516 [Puccinia triticina]
MPLYSSRPENWRNFPSAHARRASWHPRPLRLPLRSPPPIPPRNYAPLPRELLSENPDLWNPSYKIDGKENEALPHLRLELEQSSLRQRRLATKKIDGSFPSPETHRRDPPVRRYVYRQPTLILKRQFQPTPRTGLSITSLMESHPKRSGLPPSQQFPKAPIVRRS